jgi:nitrate reductase gamma subunit
MVETWIDLMTGPLFRISLAILILGLLYRLVVILAQISRAYSRANNKNIDMGASGAAMLRWLMPVRLFTARPIFSTISVLFHVGIILAPLFLAGHVAPLRPWLPSWWPVLGATAADALTLLAIVTTAALIVGRLASQRSRELSSAGDVLLLVLIFAVFGFGYLASHPQTSPWPARTMLLLHALLGNVALILTPTTKIAHCVLFPFSQLVFDLGWHYPAHTGRRVAAALGKENEPV